MKNRWFNSRDLAAEVDDVTLPRSERMFYRAGTVNAVGKGLALSCRTRLNSFEGMMEPDRLGKGFKLAKGRYIRMKWGKKRITFRLWRGQRARLNLNPYRNEHFPDFDFWDPGIEWHPCPDNLVEGIASIEAVLAKEPPKARKNPHFGIHVKENYVGWASRYSGSRFRLRSSAPFSMILKPVGIRLLSSRLKTRRLQRVATYNIPEMGPGVIFDYGGLRVWMAALDPDLKNLVPVVNEGFNFSLDNFFKLPEDFLTTLIFIKLMFKNTRDFKTELAVITLKIGRKLSVYHGPHLTRIRLPKSVRPHPFCFYTNFLTLERLVGKGTYIGYKNPDRTEKTDGMLYLRSGQVEHAVCMKIIKTK
jgi:hypothetical protein